MLKLIYFVPESHLECTKAAIFAAGAGAFEGYDQCAWQVLGTGQFRPLAGTNPAIGRIDCLEQLPEWRVETIVPEHLAAQVAKALNASHLYEVPAFEFVQLVDVTITTP